MSFTACSILAKSFSNSNSGEWTPITTSPWSLYFSDHARTWGSERSQLMQVYVQKSIRTTFPRNPAAVRGGELSHPFAPAREGNSLSTGKRSAEPGGRSTPRTCAPVPIGAPKAPASIAASTTRRVFIAGLHRLDKYPSYLTRRRLRSRQALRGSPEGHCDRR